MFFPGFLPHTSIVSDRSPKKEETESDRSDIGRPIMDPPPPPAASAPPAPSEKTTEQLDRSVDYAPYPKIDPKDLESPSHSTDTSSTPATTMPVESNPYVTPSTTTGAAASKFSVDAVRDAIGKWGKSVGDAAKSTEELAGNFWQHLKMGPSFADAAMGMITEGTKVIAEGGYENIFVKTFETQPGEQLKKSYACFLSTSAGPVRGVLYLSTAKLAFSSDNPLSYKVGDKTEWSYYKVVIPLNQLRTANPSASKVKPAEKYIQIVSVDDHEFWFMGFLNYESAVKSLQEVLFVQDLQQ